MQNGKFQLWPWEETRVSPGEYIYSLNSLKRFVEIVDISQLHTLEDVAAVASLVGHDLTVIARAKGREAEERTAYFEARADDPFGGTQMVYTFRTLLHNRELGITVKGGFATLSRFTVIGFQSYQREEMRIALPSDRDIAFGNVPNVDEDSVYAISAQGTKRGKFLPLAEPYNADVQQGFMRIVQACVEDFVQALLAHSAQSPETSDGK
jgi:hypothetical protein